MATIKLSNGKKVKLTWYRPDRYSSRSDTTWQNRFKQLCNEYLAGTPLVAGGFLVPDDRQPKGECEL